MHCLAVYLANVFNRNARWGRECHTESIPGVHCDERQWEAVRESKNSEREVEVRRLQTCALLQMCKKFSFYFWLGNSAICSRFLSWDCFLNYGLNRHRYKFSVHLIFYFIGEEGGVCQPSKRFAKWMFLTKKAKRLLSVFLLIESTLGVVLCSIEKAVLQQVDGSI